MNTQFWSKVGVLCLCWTIVGQARSETRHFFQTGAELTSNPYVAFFEPGTVVGDAVEFTTAAAGAEAIILQWDLLPAKSRRYLKVDIWVDYEPLESDQPFPVPGDNDFSFGLTDGLNIAGWERADNNGGQWGSREGFVFGNALPMYFGPLVTDLGPVLPFRLSYKVRQYATDLRIKEAGNVYHTSFLSNPLNVDGAISFFVGRGGSNENYRLNSIFIRVVEVGGCRDRNDDGDDDDDDHRNPKRDHRGDRDHKDKDHGNRKGSGKH